MGRAKVGVGRVHRARSMSDQGTRPVDVLDPSQVTANTSWTHDVDVRLLVKFTQLYLRTLFIFVLVPPRGVQGRVRTVTFLRESMILGRFRPESGGKSNLIFYFDLKYGWV